MVYPYTFPYTGYNKTRTGGTAKIFPPDDTLLPREQLNVLHYVFDEWSTYDLIYYNDYFVSPFVYEDGLFVYFLNEPISNNRHATNVKASLFERWCYETYGFLTAYSFFNALVGVLFEDLYQLVDKRMVYGLNNIPLEQYTGEPKFSINNEYPYHLFFYELDSDNSFKITRLDIPPSGLVDLTDRKIHYASMHFYVNALEDLSVFDELPDYIKRLGMDGDYFQNKIPSNSIIELKETIHEYTVEITGQNTYYVTYHMRYPERETRLISEPIGKQVLRATVNTTEVDLRDLGINDEYLFYGLIPAKNNFLNFDVEQPPSYDEYSCVLYPWKRGDYGVIYWLPVEGNLGETIQYGKFFVYKVSPVEVKFGGIVRDYIGEYIYTCNGIPSDPLRQENALRELYMFNEWQVWNPDLDRYSPTWTVYDDLVLGIDDIRPPRNFYAEAWNLDYTTGIFFEEPDGIRTYWRNVVYMEGNTPVGGTYSRDVYPPRSNYCYFYDEDDEENGVEGIIGLIPIRYVERSRLTRTKERITVTRQYDEHIILERISENIALSLIDVYRYDQVYHYDSIKSVEECWRFDMPDSIRIKEIYEICHKLQRMNGMGEYEPFLETSHQMIKVLTYDEYNELSSEQLDELRENYGIWSLLHPTGEIKWGKKGIMYVPISRRFIEDPLEKEIDIRKNPFLLVHDYLQLMLAILTDINNGLDLGALSANITPDGNTELCKHKGLRDLLSDIFYNVTTANNYTKRTFISSVLCQDHLKELIKITGLPVLNKPISSNNQGATIVSLAFEEDVPTFYLVLCNILDNIGILIAHLLKDKIKEKEDVS